ncbi:MAG: aminoacyl-tRNA hydrolase [Proteobacteria bacterium]|nr:aminoacyl-tRNA hydrolase [Pseudomonadota bacterium]
MTGIKIFVGLGNPGGEYENTRHNVGFWFNDLISSNLKLSLDKSIKFNGLYKKIPDLDNIHLLNPTTFMNDSGLSVAKILNFYKLKPEEILVIHDELDLLPGDIRLKNGGGHGGHNGLKSIISSIGTNTFWRLRIGIGHPGNKALVKAYVLKRPLKNEEAEIHSAILKGYQNLSYLINGSFEKAMLNLHTRE